SACRRGTPAAVSEASVRDQRATATCWTIVPIFIGTRSRKWSHCGRPHEVFFHLMKDTRMTAVEPNISHQYPVTASERKTDTWVSLGSSPPNCLKTPWNTGTRNATRAIITPTAKMITIVG